MPPKVDPTEVKYSKYYYNLTKISKNQSFAEENQDQLLHWLQN